MNFNHGFGKTYLLHVLILSEDVDKCCACFILEFQQDCVIVGWKESCSFSFAMVSGGI